jgi:hypothetical protein
MKKTIYEQFLKKSLFMKAIFYHFQYFGLISVKTKAFRKIFFITILRIFSSTNPESFIKIGHHFGIGG